MILYNFYFVKIFFYKNKIFFEVFLNASLNFLILIDELNNIIAFQSELRE